MKFNALILAGGSGNRLWPLSRASFPKQFLRLFDKNTLIQSSVERLSDLEINKINVVCNAEHKFFVTNQLKESKNLGNIIIEPISKNTAPAVALASFVSLLEEDDLPTIILPSDHVIFDKDSFTQSILNGYERANSKDIVTFGISPLSPHCGYGYIKAKEKIDKQVFHIDSFTEKPEYETALNFFNSGDYYWNSGIFLIKPSNYLHAIEKHCPEIFKACNYATNLVNFENDFIKINEEIFSECPSESIDYAVMEKIDNGVMVPMDAQWSDIGSWKSLWEIGSKDKNSNVIKGDVITKKTKNSLIFSENNLVTTIGLDNIAIVATKDSILVMDKNDSEDVKYLVDEIKNFSRSEWEFSREVHRPWGKYDSVDSSDGFQVKRLTVNPGAKLSVQMHYKRSEHWVVVSGIARVHYESKIIDLGPNEYTYHGKEVTHALENPGDAPLILIEVQIGSYLGEDDIVRFDDIYGRTS